MYAGSEWLGKGHNPSKLGKMVADLLGDALRGLYHLEGGEPGRVDWSHERYIDVHFMGPAATYDADLLTRLVVLAHDYCLRLEITAINEWWGPNDEAEEAELHTRSPCQGEEPPFGVFVHPVLRLRFSKREREGGVMEGHPRIEEAIEAARKGSRRPGA